MNLSLPTKSIISALAIIVSFVFTYAAQAGRPLINTETSCKAVAKYYGKKWGGSSYKYVIKGCYYYEKGKYAGTVWYGKGGWFGNQNSSTGGQKKATGKKRFDQLCNHKNAYGRYNRLNPKAKKIDPSLYAKGGRLKAPWEVRMRKATSWQPGEFPWFGWDGCDCSLATGRETKGC